MRQLRRGSISSELLICCRGVHSMLLLPHVTRCLETLKVCVWRMFVFIYVVVTVWGSVWGICLHNGAYNLSVIILFFFFVFPLIYLYSLHFVLSYVPYGKKQLFLLINVFLTNRNCPTVFWSLSKYGCCRCIL